MDEVIEFLPGFILIYGKEYRDFWMIPYDISKQFDPVLTAKIVNHLILHEVFLTKDIPGKTVPLEAFYLLAGSRLPIFSN